MIDPRRFRQIGCKVAHWGRSMTEAERAAALLLREIAGKRRSARRKGLLRGSVIAAAAVAVAVVLESLLGSQAHFFPTCLAVVLAIRYGVRLDCEREAAWLTLIGTAPMLVYFGMYKKGDFWAVLAVATLAAVASLGHLRYPPAASTHRARLARRFRLLRGRQAAAVRRTAGIKFVRL